jgi:hypothetical protein
LKLRESCGKIRGGSVVQMTGSRRHLPAPNETKGVSMDELAARAMLVSAPDVEGGVSTSVPRSQIEEALAQNETPIELILEVTRFSEGESKAIRSVAISWEPAELERLLAQAGDDEVVLTFDRDALQQAIDADVEAHGIREKALVLAVAVTAAAAGGAATASAEPGAYLGSGAPIVQSGTAPDDRAAPRGGPVASPELAPDDRAVPRGAPAPVPTATPGVAPDDRAVPRGAPVPPAELAPDDRAAPRPFSSPAQAPEPTPVVSPDDRAFPRSTPIEAPVGGTTSDPGISWAPSPAETAALAGAIALVITGAFFVVGGRRRVRPGPA